MDEYKFKGEKNPKIKSTTDEEVLKYYLGKDELSDPDTFEYFILPKKNIKCTASNAPNATAFNGSVILTLLRIKMYINANIKKAKNILYQTITTSFSEISFASNPVKPDNKTEACSFK